MEYSLKQTIRSQNKSQQILKLKSYQVSFIPSGIKVETNNKRDLENIQIHGDLICYRMNNESLKKSKEK
jgi:hypothetical protein